MTGNEYQQSAMRTLNPALSERDVLINGVMGLCGESGEAIDIVKKHLAQGHPLDREKLAKELGDIAWYLAETAQAIGYPLDDILQMNLDKLKARYPEGFSMNRSMNRDDTGEQSGSVNSCPPQFAGEPNNEHKPSGLSGRVGAA